MKVVRVCSKNWIKRLFVIDDQAAINVPDHADLFPFVAGDSPEYGPSPFKQLRRFQTPSGILRTDFVFLCAACGEQRDEPEPLVEDRCSCGLWVCIVPSVSWEFAPVIWAWRDHTNDIPVAHHPRPPLIGPTCAPRKVPQQLLPGPRSALAAVATAQSDLVVDGNKLMLAAGGAAGGKPTPLEIGQ